ncbi:hypothetical protein N431DRAFT_326021 [Stipitochalara longipes BDJ]|nr:hypothetical protein N431DRAFT_326021 [Stipitochalara longipes BDJ]
MNQATLPANMSTAIEPVTSTSPQLPSSTSPSPVMSANNAPDFEAEYEKAKQNLSFFEDAITKKKELDTITESIEEHDRELKELLEEQNKIRTQLELKNRDFNEKVSAFNEKQMEWEERDVTPEDALFLPCFSLQNLSCHVQEQKYRIKLAKANLAMLEESVQIYEEGLASQAINDKSNCLDEESGKKRQVINSLKEREATLRKAYNEAVKQWKTKRQVSNPNNSLDAMSTLEKRNTEITQLKNERSSLEAENKSGNETIASLRKQIVQMKPIWEVGMEILARKREMQKPNAVRDPEVVERGNKAAHFGTALADAHRIIYGPHNFHEVAWYLSHYGFKPLFVLLHGPQAPTFLEVVEWRAAIKHFQSTVACKDSNSFLTEFEKFKATVALLPTRIYSPTLESSLSEDLQGKLHYQAMKNSYEAAYKKHKERRVKKLHAEG